MNNKIKVEDLENTNGNEHFNIMFNKLRDDFYYLCQENPSEDIEKCFQSKNINSQMTKYIISYGLMGAARTNKIENAKMLLECAKTYKQMDINNISFNPAINLALKKNHVDFAHELIVLTNFFKNTVICEMKRKVDVDDKKSAYVAFILDQSGSMRQTSILEDKYNKFSVVSFELFDKDREKIEWLLNHDIHLNYIKNMVKKSVEKSNFIPLISLVKSQYLESLLKDEDFEFFMKDTDFKNIKTEFQHLIDNALLEKKLNEKLPEKNTKISTVKI